MKVTLTNNAIRAYTRRHPRFLDMLMVAIHSADTELRTMARRWFAMAIAVSGGKS